MKKILLLLLITLFTLPYSFSQKTNPNASDVIDSTFIKAPCTGGTNDDCANAINIIVGDACVNGNTCDGTIEAGEPAPICDATQTQTVWYTFTATDPSITISIDITGSSCFATSAVYSGGCGFFTQISCADNAIVLTNFLTNLIVGDIYYIQVAYGDGGPCSNQAEFCISADITELGESCDSSTPFCTGTTETFTADVGSVAPLGNDYGCLLSQPNPSWFYLEIDNSGDIEITMTNSNTVDIDFKIWGPFASTTDGCDNLAVGNDIDCSFSAATTEVANIVGANAGEIYILLITNYSNTPTDISFSQTGGIGTTDCAILPVELKYFKVVEVGWRNIINWGTFSEINNSHFIIERSGDGDSWEELHIEEGGGTSTSTLNYYFMDDEVKPQLNYYRLTQVDFNGEEETFNIVVVDNRIERFKPYKIVNLMGQEISESYNGIKFYLYSDGSMKKMMGL